jgi:hypothetical protein
MRAGSISIHPWRLDIGSRLANWLFHVKVCIERLPLHACRSAEPPLPSPSAGVDHYFDWTPHTVSSFTPGGQWAAVLLIRVDAGTALPLLQELRLVGDSHAVARPLRLVEPCHRTPSGMRIQVMGGAWTPGRRPQPQRLPRGSALHAFPRVAVHTHRAAAAGGDSAAAAPAPWVDALTASASGG